MRKACRVIALVGPDLERRRADLRQAAVMRKRGLHHLPERAQGRACRHRIGGIGNDQHGRLVAAPDRPLEIAMNFDEQDLTGRQHLIELGLGGGRSITWK